MAKRSKKLILKDKAWAILSKLKRYSSCKCSRCGKLKDPKILHAHHLIPKSHGNYARFEFDNIIVLCRYCHKFWWHGDSTWEEQRNLIDKWIGLDRYYEMKKIADTEIRKYTEEDYQEMIDKWTEEFEPYE